MGLTSDTRRVGVTLVSGQTLADGASVAVPTFGVGAANLAHGARVRTAATPKNQQQPCLDNCSILIRSRLTYKSRLEECVDICLKASCCNANQNQFPRPTNSLNQEITYWSKQLNQ